MDFFTNLAQSPNKKWWILAAMSLSLGMTFIDQAAVAIALPKMQLVFHLRSDFLPWIVNAYLLAFAVFLIPGGHLGTIFKVHHIFFTGLSIFLVASIACALALDTTTLITFRALQGLGAGLVLPNTSAIIINTFPEEERGKAMGIYMGSSLLFLPMALVLGGLFTEYISWRLIFWLNLPLCLFCMVFVYYTVGSSPQKKGQEQINWLDSVALILAISTLVFAIMESSHLGWNSDLIKILLCCSLFFFISFYFLEKRTGNPILDFKLFTNRVFLSATIITFFISISVGLFIFEAIYYQQVLGYEPAIASLLFSPSILSIAISAPICGKMYDCYGYKTSVISGLFILFMGLLLNAKLVLMQSYLYLLPGIILTNIGISFILSTVVTASLSAVEKIKRSIASGVLQSVNKISGCINLAVLTAIIFNYNNHLIEVFWSEHQDRYPFISITALKKMLSNPHLTNSEFNPQQLATLYEGVKTAYTSAFSLAFMICAGFTLTALFLAIILLKNNLVPAKTKQVND